MPLVFKASVIEMNSRQILVDFRLSRVSSLESILTKQLINNQLHNRATDWNLNDCLSLFAMISTIL